MVHHPNELPDRDPLVTDWLEVADDPSPEESALHLVLEPDDDGDHDAVRELAEMMEGIAILDADELAVDERF